MTLPSITEQPLESPEVVSKFENNTSQSKIDDQPKIEN